MQEKIKMRLGKKTKKNENVFVNSIFIELFRYCLL